MLCVMCNSQKHFSAVYKVTIYKTIKLTFITRENPIVYIISLEDNPQQEFGDFTPDPKAVF